MTKELELRADFTVALEAFVGGDNSITRAARVSVAGAGAREEEENAGLINFLMKNKHGTPFEHNSMTFYIEAPIFVFREWHRHRIGVSINEMSGRYRELEPVFYAPAPERPLVQEGKPGAYTFVQGTKHQWHETVTDLTIGYDTSYRMYKRMLARGTAREVARAVLGTGIYSAMYWTCNARSLMAFLSLRTNDPTATFPSKPQWEIAQCAQHLEGFFKTLFPLTHAAYCKNGRVAP